jgi:hypothetical protein
LGDLVMLCSAPDMESNHHFCVIVLWIVSYLLKESQLRDEAILTNNGWLKAQMKVGKAAVKHVGF